MEKGWKIFSLGTRCDACKSRWVSLMILLGKFAISPLDLTANPLNHPPTPQTYSLCNCSDSLKIIFCQDLASHILSLLAAATTRGCLGGNSDPMHLSNFCFQGLCHQLMLLHQPHSTEVWSLNKHLDERNWCLGEEFKE